jgi:predicted nucleotidyltransferase
MIDTDKISKILLDHYPAIQAIYLFGSIGTDDEWPDSDVDIAILLPPDDAKRSGNLALSAAHLALETEFGKDVDLINLRLASTVLGKEVVMADRRIYCANSYAADEFEMLTISFYQKLNQERAEILKEGLNSGRFYDV